MDGPCLFLRGPLARPSGESDFIDVRPDLAWVMRLRFAEDFGLWLAILNLRCDVRFRSDGIIGYISPVGPIVLIRLPLLAIHSKLKRESTLFRIVPLERHT